MQGQGSIWRTTCCSVETVMDLCMGPLVLAAVRESREMSYGWRLWIISGILLALCVR